MRRYRPRPGKAQVRLLLTLARHIGGHLAAGVEGVARLLNAVLAQEPVCAPGLKGSVGEGPNQTNYSDQSSVKILSKFGNFR